MAKKRTTADDFSDTAHKVWLAGLGALATAGREGEKLFATLVSRGEKLEKKLDPAVDRAGKNVRKTVNEVRSRAGRTFGSIQTAIDGSVSSALHRLGVPTRNEIAALSTRVEKLTRAVEGRKAGRKKPARAAGRKRAAKKKTVKRRAARTSP